MAIIIEYLLLNIVLLVFSVSHYFSVIGAFISVILSLVFQICLYRVKRKGEIIKKGQICTRFILIIMMIIVLNLLYEMRLINLIFQFGLCIYFIIFMIFFFKKKKYLDNSHLFNVSYLFDMYSCLCLLYILKLILNYKI